jgi:hypothetical protein
LVNWSLHDARMNKVAVFALRSSAVLKVLLTSKLRCVWLCKEAAKGKASNVPFHRLSQK